LARWTGPALLASLALLATAAPALARRPAPDTLPPLTVEDLPYGDVLFYYYQGRDFEAAARLMAYEQLEELPHHGADGRLLLGGLYLSLGMTREAGRLFKTLLTGDVPVGVRNRAWFYLARVRFTRGDLEGAEQALGRIQGSLSRDLEPQRQLLAAEVLMREGHFARAARQLTPWRSSQQGWTAYARFNLGVALAREGKLADAAPYLESVGTMYALAPEMLALKDRANLALGVAYLKARQPSAADAALDRVRLSGPFSNQALLAAGWAQASAGDYRAALTPWLTLSERSPYDASVQEAYLTVPYAFVRLDAQAQATRYYRTAVASYGAAEARLDRAVERIRTGTLIAQLLAQSHGAQQAALGGNDLLNDGALPDRMRYRWYWHLEALPHSAESNYLYGAFAGHAFQQGLRNYRDLELMGRMLAQWSDSMAAFEDMIAARRRAYAERLPAVDAMLSSKALARLERREAALTGRLEAVARNHDVVALATRTQRAEWARVEHLQAALAAAPATPTFTSLEDRARLVRGVLLYQMSEQFPRRLWQAHRQLVGIDGELFEAEGLWHGLEAERHSVPSGTGGFAARVKGLERRLRALQGQVAAAERAQAGELVEVAVRRLERQRQQLEEYRTQAQFALATIYDQAAHGGAGKPAPSTAAPPGSSP
jgi:hypothetical protein